jgi:DNA-binding NtrC family response regulator
MVVHVHVPPLRERAGDVLLLAQHFVERAAGRMRKNVRGLSSPAAQRLLAYAWPGNVRELLNCMERAVALTEFEQITVEDLPERIRRYESKPLVIAASSDELVSLSELERRYLHKVLESVDGNKAAAARVLGVDRTTLYRMMDRFGIRRD